MPEQDQRLEQRIKTLEYEFKILKNEIQRSLLDIQEQVLSHYYPALRAEEAAPADDVVQAMGAIKEKKGAIGTDAAVRAAKAAADNGGDETPAALAGATSMVEEAPAKIKQVSLEEIRKTRSGAEGGAQPTQATDQSALLALSGWVSNSVEKIGQERTRTLIDLFATKGFLAANMKDVLSRLAALGNGPSRAERVATNEVLTTILRLNEVLGRRNDPEEALTLIEEAKLG
jgi:hypothetical protein